MYFAFEVNPWSEYRECNATMECDPTSMAWKPCGWIKGTVLRSWMYILCMEELWKNCLNLLNWNETQGQGISAGSYWATDDGLKAVDGIWHQCLMFDVVLMHADANIWLMEAQHSNITQPKLWGDELGLEPNHLKANVWPEMRPAIARTIAVNRHQEQAPAGMAATRTIW